MSDAQQIADQVVGLITTYGLDVIGAIIILIVGWIVSGWVYRMVDKGLGRIEKFDVTLRGFFASFAKYLVLIFTGLAVLSQFGIQTASLIAVLGAAGLAIGLALQGTLSNVAAGVMLLLFRPFKVGDYVEAGGHAGTIKAISLFVTEMATPDNVQILIPNSAVWGSSVMNYSYHPQRRVDFLIGIGYGDDISKAMTAVRAVIGADNRALNDPEPMVVVGELGDSSVNLIVRVWCNAADYWAVKFDMTKAIKERLDADGIEIPFPQRVVHMAQAAG